jgi:hypothetical protein
VALVEGEEATCPELPRQDRDREVGEADVEIGVASVELECVGHRHGSSRSRY